MCFLVGIRSDQPIYNFGINPNVLLPSVSIACAIEPGPSSEMDIQWKHNNGTYNVNNTNGRHKVNVTHGLTFITINSVSYQDNGTYYCTVKISGSGFDQWVFDKVDLILHGKIMYDKRLL